MFVSKSTSTNKPSAFPAQSSNVLETTRLHQPEVTDGCVVWELLSRSTGHGFEPRFGKILGMYEVLLSELDFLTKKSAVTRVMFA